ncbi:MAG: hypothetical protein H6566_21785 [Lewinellaceae bacterium]|nr:hypothetical protein [Lewinellaceae bacterium]
MIKSLIIGIGGIVFLMVIWAVIQSWWGKTFADNISDDDVLAGRMSCGNCGCTTVCENKRRELTTK